MTGTNQPMAKLVVLSEGLTGRSFDLKDEKVSIGRLEDNAFQIPEPSVSSHHCEVVRKGNDLLVKDLNSTNGTFISGEQVKGEGILKPGQILRLGQIEMRLETGAQTPGKMPLDQTRAIPQGVKFDLERSGLDKNSPFAKKSNKIAMVFIGIGVVLVIIIVAFLVIAFQKMQ